MANPFDEFDAKPSANPFDEFDAPAPKMPDTSGVQNLARSNLAAAANDNKDVPENGEPRHIPTPMQNLNTAAGFPVDKLIKGSAAPSDFTSKNRSQYARATSDGSAANSSDWHQTLLHAITPSPDNFLAHVGELETGFVKDMLNPEHAPTGMTGEQYLEWKRKQPKQGWLAQLGEDTSFPMGLLAAPVSGVISAFGAGGEEVVKHSYSPEEWAAMPPEEKQRKLNLGATVGQAIGGVGVAISPLLNRPIRENVFSPSKEFEPKPSSEGPIIEGEYSSSERKLLIGPKEVWNDYPGSEPIWDAVAEKLGKDVNEVTSHDIDTVIAEGSHNVHPPIEDFKSVSTVTDGAISESALKDLWVLTGITPEHFVRDVQSDPQIAVDVAAGKIPDKYVPLIQEPTAPAKALNVQADIDDRSFKVVDGDGDLVMKGFESWDDAREYIKGRERLAKDKESEERAAIEEEGNAVAEKAPEEDNLTPSQQRYKAKSAEERDATRSAEKAKLEDLENQVRPYEDGTYRDLFPDEIAQRDELRDRANRIRKNIEEYDAIDSMEKRKFGDEATKARQTFMDELKIKSEPVASGNGFVVYALDKKGRDRLDSIGEVQIVPNADGTYSVARIFVNEDVRGNGIATRLLDEVYKQLPEGAVIKRALETNVGRDFRNNYDAARLARKNTPNGELDVAGKQGEQLAAANEGRMKPRVGQKAADDGLFDVAGRGQGDIFDLPVEKSIDTTPTAPTPKPKLSVIEPSKSGKPTSLRTFLKNNGAKFDESGNLLSMKDENGKVRPSDLGKDRATELAHEYGYTDQRLSIPELENLVKDRPEHTRMQDAERDAKSRESAAAKELADRTVYEAEKVGIDSKVRKGETKAKYLQRLTDALVEFYKDQEGAMPPDVYRQIIGESIKAVENFTGKLTGNTFKQLGEGYIKTFQPELMGDKALLLDAFLAKYKTSLQEAENAYFRQNEREIRRWDRASRNDSLDWLYDHETGRWNEIDNPDHARFQTLMDAAHQIESKIIGKNGDEWYKENYLPHVFKKDAKSEAYFSNENMLKKYGPDWFTKKSTFKLLQDAVRAGLELETYNPERILMDRLMASNKMVRSMDLLLDAKGSGIAIEQRAFSVDKRIAKKEAEIVERQKKYKEAFEKKNPAGQVRAEGIPPVSSSLIERHKAVLEEMRTELDALKNEKSAYGNSVDAELKDGYRVLGPDNKVWLLDKQVVPLWKNAMEMKGLWERQGLAGNTYRGYMQAKATWVSVKLALSLFHPIHIAGIHLASGTATAAHHLIQGGKLSDLNFKNTSLRMGFDKNSLSNLKYLLKDNSSIPSNKTVVDGDGVTAWNTPIEERTPAQQEMVTRMVEGGFKPTMSAQDMVRFRDNLDKAISGIGVNNLRLLGAALQVPGKAMAPAMEHWIPALKSESYLLRTELALKRDPSLKTDAGRRGIVFRRIAQDVDRNYGEINQEVVFWNKYVKDIFNASMLSGGWKLAMLQNFRGLAEPAKIGYNYAKTGEFSKAQISEQILQSYVYTAYMLMMGALITKMLIGKWGDIKDWMNPDTGDVNSDGSKIRITPPAFFKEFTMMDRDVDEEGLLPGMTTFMYHQTLYPGIKETLGVAGDGISDLLTLSRNPIGKDGLDRTIISDPLDLQQWASYGYDSLAPITVTSSERAESKHSYVAELMNYLGFPIAGAYVDQSAFERKVLHAYHESNPTQYTAYSAKLKTKLQDAIYTNDSNKSEAVKAEMKRVGMTEKQITQAQKIYTEPFVNYAWTKLSPQEQRHLLESATEDEKQKFQLETQ